MTEKRKSGFANLSPERRKEIAAMGGRASPGNFANMPERASIEGRKGGKISRGNFKVNRDAARAAGAKGGTETGRVRRFRREKGLPAW